MDILKLIKGQIKEIQKFTSEISLDSVRTHISRAERLYQLGKENGDEQFFTDVIYRTNQAFEGSLKQAYVILADKTEEEASRKRTVDIESFLETESIFKDRVLHHFKNYRREWRNKSTHDFRLFFTEGEAFLAIVNVSAYTYLLFNQMIEKLAYLSEKERLEREVDRLKYIEEVASDESISLRDQVILLIEEFSRSNAELFNDKSFREIELIGAFHAFVEAASSEFEVLSNVSLSSSDGRRAEVDVLIGRGTEGLLLEVKRGINKYYSSYEDQVLKYLDITGDTEAIIWLAKPLGEEGKYDVINNLVNVGGSEYEISILR